MDLIRFEEEDAEVAKADKLARAEFVKLTTQINNICQEMGAVKRLTRTSKAIQHDMDKVEALTAADPTKDYSDCFADLTYQMAVLTSGLFDSTIDPTHSCQLPKMKNRERPYPQPALKERCSHFS